MAECSDREPREYLLVVQAPGRAISAGEFSIEAAFAVHLRELKQHLGDRFGDMVVATPAFSESFYQENRGHLGSIRAEEGIRFLPLFDADSSSVRFWLREAVASFLKLWRQSKRSSVVHAGLASDIWRPVVFFAVLCGVFQGRTTLFFADIDFRNSAWMNYKTGSWSLKSYLLCRYVYDSLRKLQIWFAVRWCSLVHLKGVRMVEDFGKGRPHVHNLLDTVHSESDILTAEELDARTDRLLKRGAPLRLVYFGRLVEYKGLDRSIRAVHRARESSGRDIEYHVIGTGDQKERLERLVRELGAESSIFFHDPLPYGEALFAKLDEFDLALATPLAEDTPRAAFDGMARGLPIVAFDTLYYGDLQALTPCVTTTRWPEIEPLAREIIALDENRERITEMSRAAVAFARENTQPIWLARRVEWTLEAMKGR